MRFITILGIVAILSMTGCATAPLAIEGSRGFFWGLFDGAVAPISFVVSWFSDSVGIYGSPNSGGWYDFGFLLGVGMWAGGGCAAGRRRRRDW